MFNSFDIVILNAILYIVVFFYYYKQKKCFDLGILILLIYAVSNCISVFYFSFDYVALNFKRITVIPYIYLFILTFICIYPLLKFNSNRITNINAVGSTVFIDLLTSILILVTIEPFIENLSLILKNNNQSSNYLAEIYEARNQGLSISVFSEIGRRLNYISNLFATTSVVFFFYYLTKVKKSKYKIIGLSLVIFNTILTYYNTSNRAGVLSYFLFIISCYFLFKNSLNPIILKRIKYYGFLFGGIVLTLTLIVTIARFSANESSSFSVFSWIALYGGEGSLKFNSDLWYIHYHTMGDDMFCFLKDILGLETFIDNTSRDSFYFSRNGIQIENFYTVIGDVFYDFGFFGAPIFCLIIYYFAKEITKIKKQYPLEIIFTIALVTHVFLMGFAAYIHRAYSAQFGLIFPGLVIVVLYINRFKHRYL